MGLVFLGKGFIQRGRGDELSLPFFCEWLTHRIETLYGGIKIEIQGGGDAELRQRMFYGGLHKCIDDLLIFEFDFLFGGMHIDVELRRIKIDEQHIQGKLSEGIISVEKRSSLHGSDKHS